MLMTGYMMGFGGGSSPDATVTFAASTVDTDNLTAYTFSSHAIGTANSSRKVVVGTRNANAVAVSTLTVGGISGSLVVASGDPIGGHVELWQTDVPTGTTADIVVTFASGVSNCGVGVYAVNNAASSAFATAIDISSTFVQNITIPAGGVLIGAGGNLDTSAFSWTNLTERYDEAVEGVNVHTGASDAFATLQTDRTITMTPASPDAGVMVLASWAKA